MAVEARNESKIRAMRTHLSMLRALAKRSEKRWGSKDILFFPLHSGERIAGVATSTQVR